MFTDPKELALGHSEPVVDTNTALAAKRRLGTLYKSITQAVRHEAVIMKAVFARPKEALSSFVHRLFEQRIQVCPPDINFPFQVTQEPSFARSNNEWYCAWLTCWTGLPHKIQSAAL